MFYIIKSIILGFFTGFIASIPLGPSGLESVNRSISKNFLEGFKVSFGAVLADVTYIIIINLGLFSMFSHHNHLNGLFWILCGILLIVITIPNTRFKKNKDSNSDTKNIFLTYSGNGILTGYLITFLNPTTPSLWIALSGTLFQVWKRHGRLFFLLATSSMILGSLAWFVLLNILATRGFKKSKSNGPSIISTLLNYFLFALGIVFIILGFIKLL
ncbi:LysE family transporter [Clostridium sp. BJN0001]|uniref:LysE family transporter n=1 Tax=Clostridium sp. BJN0001 TaxID=2930219 RepID=UPI001FD37B6D|nr:LysE family transporter [Clostridium sp. BJN0001]